MTDAKQFPSFTGPAAGLPGTAQPGTHYTIIDAASSTDCTTGGGGSATAECVFLNGAWTPAGSSGASRYNWLNDPTSYVSVDTWPNDTAQLTWTWGNQGSATETISQDSAFLQAPSGETGDHYHVRWAALPGSGNWVASIAFTPIVQDAYMNIGLVLLDGGSIATPTSMRVFGLLGTGPSACQLDYSIFTNYTTLATPSVATAPMGTPWSLHQLMVFYAKFTDSSNAVELWYSQDGYTPCYFTTLTASANPTYFGYFVNNNSAGYQAGVRVFKALVVSGTSLEIGGR